MNNKVLVIEDERDIRESLKTILELSDFFPEVAVNGEDGIDKISTFQPDIILCDVMMPVMDGFTFLAKIRKEGIDIPLIFLTAKAQHTDLKTGMSLGAHDYLFKPFKSVDLLKAINKALNNE